MTEKTEKKTSSFKQAFDEPCQGCGELLHPQEPVIPKGGFFTELQLFHPDCYKKNEMLEGL